MVPSLGLQNEGKWGPMSLPLPPTMVELFEVMEKASHKLAPKCPTLFFTPSTKEPFTQGGHFTTHTTKLLSIHGKHVCALDMRHEFITCFEDFKGAKPELFTHGNTLVEAVARWIGNSTTTWAKAYDFKAHTRDMEEVMRVYPTFQAWMRSQARHAKSKRPRDPME